MKTTLSIFKSATLILGVLSSSFVISQQEVHFCHTNEKMDEYRNADPSISLDMQNSANELEAFTANFIANEYDPNNRTAIYTIPVVFHILHTDGAENISDEQVHSAMQLMNDNFNKLNTSWNTVHSSFLGIVADCQIEFKLARKTNTGACTNGITRTYTATTHSDTGNDQVAAVQAAQGNWPGHKYLNIFVVNDAGGAAGYTTYPSNWSATSMSNGIKILHNYVGSIGTSNMSVSTALTHEVGHWLNLKHCWGDSNNPGLSGNCSDDDNVTDTPNTIGWTSCNVNGTSCSSLDNVENYMEYSYCSKMYTEGQKARMHAALNSSTGSRNNLWTPANLSFTGVSLPEALCQVVYSADKTEICVGESVTFTDASYNAVTGYNWTFTGGTPSTSTSSSPVITYNTPGVYNVSLQATDGTTSITNTKTAYIVVLANPGDALPYSEGFETLASFPDNVRFTRYNGDGGQAWSITSTAGSTGTKSVKLNNFGVTPEGSFDSFMSGPIDLSGVNSTDNIVFNFRYAYRQRNSADDEWLRFYISKDCGETWVLRKNIHGTALSNVVSTSAYTPASEADWYTVSVTNINSDYYVSNFRFKFEFENDGGNNIYIDDINLYPASWTGINEPISPIGALSVYPNPVNNQMTVQLETVKNSPCTITLVNALGELVGNIYNGELSFGLNQINYSTADLPKGIYFLRVEADGIIETRKVVKN